MAKVLTRKSVGKASSKAKKFAAKSSTQRSSTASVKSEKLPGSLRRASKKGNKKPAGAYQIVGTTSDGVVILRPKAKPTHFTLKEIRQAISAVVKR